LNNLEWNAYEAGPRPDGMPKPVAWGFSPNHKFTLPEGRYRILVRTDQAKSEKEIEVRAGMLGTTEFVLNAGTIELTAIFAPGGPRAESVDWMVYEAEPDAGGNFRRLTSGYDSKQRFTLTAGRYRIKVATGAVEAVQEIEVRAGVLDAKE